MIKKIFYHRTKCIGCGACVIKAPHIWEMNMNDGKADLIDGESKKDYYFRMFWPDEKQLLDEIVNSCPTRAIQLA